MTRYLSVRIELEVDDLPDAELREIGAQLSTDAAAVIRHADHVQGVQIASYVLRRR